MLKWSIADDGGNQLELKPGFADVSAQGDNVLIPAVPGRSIHVLQYMASVADDVNVRFQSDETPITSMKFLSGGGGMAGDSIEHGYLFKTALGEPLVLNLSAAVAVGIDLLYVEVGA